MLSFGILVSVGDPCWKCFGWIAYSQITARETQGSSDGGIWRPTCMIFLRFCELNVSWLDMVRSSSEVKLKLSHSLQRAFLRYLSISSLAVFPTEHPNLGAISKNVKLQIKKLCLFKNDELRSSRKGHTVLLISIAIKRKFWVNIFPKRLAGTPLVDCISLTGKRDQWDVGS